MNLENFLSTKVLVGMSAIMSSVPICTSLISPLTIFSKIKLDWIVIDWIRSDYIGLDQDYIGLDQIRFTLVDRDASDEKNDGVFGLSRDLLYPPWTIAMH